MLDRIYIIKKASLSHLHSNLSIESIMACCVSFVRIFVKSWLPNSRYVSRDCVLVNLSPFQNYSVPFCLCVYVCVCVCVFAKGMSIINCLFFCWTGFSCSWQRSHGHLFRSCLNFDVTDTLFISGTPCQDSAIMELNATGIWLARGSRFLFCSQIFTGCGVHRLLSSNSPKKTAINP